ncbi:MAG: hypothetical protein LBI13_07455 [Streptococcaceae bacterium]|nr:hypothetical protein [Streptococcaceae bacterium]
MVKKRSKFSTRKIIFISLIVGLFMSLVLLSFLVKDNLAKYSVYYAGNLPHKSGTNPELVAIIDNLDKIYIPNLDESTHTIEGGLSSREYVYSRDRKYEYSFYESEINYKNTKVELDFESTDEKDVAFLITEYGKNSRDYHIDSNGKLIYITKNSSKRYNPNAEEVKNFEKNKGILFGNIIKAKQKPSVNLQFIYNYLNEPKFN